MKVILIIIDGAMTNDYKDCENINYIMKNGEYGFVENTPKGLSPNSLTCILNILGVDKKYIPNGRAYLEALAVNEKVEKDDLIFRCNNIQIHDGKLTSSCSVENSIPKSMPSNTKLIKMSSYKNLLIVKGAGRFKDSIKTYPPHENINKNIAEIMPECNDYNMQKLMNNLITKYSLYPWGEAVLEYIPSFEEIHNMKGAIVCKTEIVKGIGKAMKMHCPDIKNTTADVDTDLLAKGKTALDLIDHYDFVLLHINGSDESAHRKNQAEKVDFIKKIDNELLNYLIENLKDDTSLIITSDHGTSSESGKHVSDPVPYYILNKNNQCNLWLKRNQ